MVTMSSEYSIYLYREKVDLRKGISGLSGIVRSEMKMNPNTANSIYVFSGSNLRIKKLRYCQQRAGAGRTSGASLNEMRAEGKMVTMMVRERIDKEYQQNKGRRSACLVHIRRVFVDAIIENEPEAMWFVDAFGRMFAIEHYCATRGLIGEARLVERLKPRNTADIMKRIEERLETFRKSEFAGCGQMLKKALKYAIGE